MMIESYEISDAEQYLRQTDKPPISRIALLKIVRYFLKINVSAHKNTYCYAAQLCNIQALIDFYTFK